MRIRAVPAAGALLAAHAALAAWGAWTHAPTFDEPVHLAGGAALWKTGDARLSPNDPPLALLWASAPVAAALPSWPSDWPEWQGGYAYATAEKLLYWNGYDGVALTRRARLMNLALSLVFGALLFAFLRRRWGDEAALAGLALYAFSPAVLAFAGLATPDLPAALLAAASALLLGSFMEKPSPRGALAFAAAACAAALCKYSAILVWPAAGAAVFLRRGADAAKARRAWLAWAVLPAAAAALGLAAAWPDLARGLWARIAQAGAGLHPSFALGRHSDAGFVWAYALAVAVKSTLPELAALAAVAVFAVRRGLDRRLAPAAWLALACFVAASLSRKQTGLRYMLVVYPLLAALAAGAAREALAHPRGRLLAGLLAAWQAACALGAAPHHLAYFNELAGGPYRGWRVLADSNLDWGQDLGRLSEWVKERAPAEVVLSYFGTASPELYGLRVQHYGSHAAVQRRLVNSEAPAREYLAVSATNLAGVYPPRGEFDWLRERAPAGRPGPGMFVYDITEDAGAHERLAEGYERRGEGPPAARHRRRAEALRRRR